MAKGKSICVYGAKGGIGKTTFILNLAGTLSNLNKRVLIIDLDLSNGAIACSLNANLTKTIYNFCDDYNNNRFDDIEDYFIKYNENISLYPDSVAKLLICPEISENTIQTNKAYSSCRFEAWQVIRRKSGTAI